MVQCTRNRLEQRESQEETERLQNGMTKATVGLALWKGALIPCVIVRDETGWSQALGGEHVFLAFL